MKHLRGKVKSFHDKFNMLWNKVNSSFNKIWRWWFWFFEIHLNSTISSFSVLLSLWLLFENHLFMHFLVLITFLIFHKTLNFLCVSTGFFRYSHRTKPLNDLDVFKEPMGEKPIEGNESKYLFISHSLLHAHVHALKYTHSYTADQWRSHCSTEHSCSILKYIWVHHMLDPFARETAKHCDLGGQSTVRYSNPLNSLYKRCQY